MNLTNSIIVFGLTKNLYLRGDDELDELFVEYDNNINVNNYIDMKKC